MQPEQVALCQLCTKLIINDSSAPVLEHWPTLADLQPSSVDCAVCNILLRCFEVRVKEALDRFNHLEESTVQQRCPLSLNLIDYKSYASGICYKLIEAGIHLPNKFTYTWKFHIAARESPAPPLTPTAWDNFPSSAETKLSKIRDWLRICESSHPQCGSIWHCRLPGRLVDVGSDDLRGFKLVSTAGLNSNNIKYTALSYCWGAAPGPLKTTKETVADYHRNGIPQSKLSKTFLDAAWITRGLGLRYIWIDALCIVQDDEDDWATEASKMSDIYHGSTFCVAANDSTSATGGVFVQSSSILYRRKAFARCFLRSVNPKTGSDTLIHIVPREKHRSALNHRGWTLQESVLSPRLVGITNSELKWSCKSGIFWESGIEYAQSETAYGNPPMLRASFTEKRIWWRWMENYSSRRLTFSQDRLPAILGLVNYYQRLMQDVPVLGLWESSLREGLLWKRLTDRSERLPDRLADHANLPSWSPYSCDQAVAFECWFRNDDERHGDSVEFCVEVLGHEVLWEGTPYLSRLQSSSLVVAGPSREIYLSEATEVPGCNPPYFTVDDEEVVDTAINPLPWRCAVQWDVEGYRPPQTWLCLLLRKMRTKGYEFGAETFLVLESVGAPQTYRRVGIGSLGRRRTLDGLAEQEWKFDDKVRSKITLV